MTPSLSSEPEVFKVEGRTLELSGVDLVEGTPVIDIKPYIPCYDAPYAVRTTRRDFLC